MRLRLRVGKTHAPLHWTRRTLAAALIAATWLPGCSFILVRRPAPDSSRGTVECPSGAPPVVDLSFATAAGVLGVNFLTYCNRNTCETASPGYLGVGLSAVAIVAAASGAYGLYQVASCHEAPERSQAAQESLTSASAERRRDEVAVRRAAELRASEQQARTEPPR